ncbi:type II toxin-antitoxin system RelE/ParE family toxin [Candidimonas humi]|uniref:Type II toxin-antitoxin system RelE/ParE family toxin n=1 Tax=Candidimonas humi TaxID=683355 RepID=A0ABV8NYU2_9BURK|nr:type II toxin-antitoxin system RelE/ParE family toxin [Candidimonas humi]MBV6306947.1 type II toxin-antitoxin system RelE/ParE family toxin [Candidimonas humi]
MRPKPVIPRALARRDVEDALDYLLNVASERVALGFVDSLEQAYVRISRHPNAGSPRYAHELGLADLRHWRLKRYPYLVFYIEQPDHIDVWRVLHGMRDIPEWLGGVPAPGEPPKDEDVDK